MCQQQEAHMRDLVKLQGAADQRQTQREDRIVTLEKDLHEFHANYMQLQSHLTKLVVEREELGRQMHAQQVVIKRYETQSAANADPVLSRSLSITPPVSYRTSDMNMDIGMSSKATFRQLPGQSSEAESQSLQLPARNQMRPMALPTDFSEPEYRANSAPPSSNAHHLLAERLWAATRSSSAVSESLQASKELRPLPDKQAFLDMLRSKT
jgi:hypothetical protein